MKRSDNGELIYDFGQNFAGIVRFSVRDAREGQVITVKHAEILNPDGSLNTTFCALQKLRLYTPVQQESKAMHRALLTWDFAILA